jgi:hypothetical protein
MLAAGIVVNFLLAFPILLIENVHHGPTVLHTAIGDVVSIGPSARCFVRARPFHRGLRRTVKPD